MTMMKNPVLKIVIRETHSDRRKASHCEQLDGVGDSKPRESPSLSLSATSLFTAGVLMVLRDSGQNHISSFFFFCKATRAKQIWSEPHLCFLPLPAFPLCGYRRRRLHYFKCLSVFYHRDCGGGGGFCGQGQGGWKRERWSN